MCLRIHCLADGNSRGNMTLYQSHPYPGKLIVAEGLEGSTKSLQARLLKDWLESRRVAVVLSDWSPTRTGQKSPLLTGGSDGILPLSFSILHATDFAARQEGMIVPALKSGLVVLADQYCFAAFARDALMGVDRQWLRHLYSFAIRPDCTFYFRLASGERPGESARAGDLIDANPAFQDSLIREYEAMVFEFNFNALPEEATPHEQHKIVCEQVQSLMEAARP